MKRNVRMRRFDWLARVVRETDWMCLGAEIGVKEGKTVASILSADSNVKMIAVDPWAPYPSSDESIMNAHYDHQKCFQEFSHRIKPYQNRCTVLKMKSTDALGHVRDASLDFVFIDADHSYDMVKADILGWCKKLVKGGMISGHDYNWDDVRAAVKELIPNHRLAGHDNVWWANKEDVRSG